MVLQGAARDEVLDREVDALHDVLLLLALVAEREAPRDEPERRGEPVEGVPVAAADAVHRSAPLQSPVRSSDHAVGVGRRASPSTTHNLYVGTYGHRTLSPDGDGPQYNIYTYNMYSF